MIYREFEANLSYTRPYFGGGGDGTGQTNKTLKIGDEKRLKKKRLILFMFCFTILVLRIESRASYMPGKCLTIEIHLLHQKTN